MNYRPEEEKVETTEEVAGKEPAPTKKKPKQLKVINKDFANTRMTIANWLLIIASFGVFLGGGTAIANGAGNKDWVFWVALIGIGFLGASILAGIASHIAYAGGSVLAPDSLVVPSNEKIYSWDNCSLISLWFQMGLFGVGMTLAIVSLLSFWIKFSPVSTMSP